MPEVSQRTIQTNGISMHIAEAGEGPLVILCHGFPESWYSWRHQLPVLAEAGFHAVAPDQRGYGKTDAPEPIEAYSLFHLVGDIVGLVAALGEEQAVIVGHDWGSPVAWSAAQWRPDIFRAVASLSVPTRDRGPMPPLQLMDQIFGDRFFYQIYFQTPGVAEHELQHDVGQTMRKLLVGASGAIERPTLFDASASPPKSAYMLETMEDPGEDLPAWLTSADVAFFTEIFEQTGFRGGLNWYRNIDRNWELSGPFQGKRIEQPAFFMAGDRDVVPFNAEAETAMRAIVPDLRGVHVLPKVGHWTQQEAPEAVNEGLLSFLKSL
ncbi:MAG: alpha/beta fold hydrolase [Dehalococcoidia bacterium]